LTKTCQQKRSFCNGNGGNVDIRCTDDSPTLLNLDYICVLEDNGQVRAEFSLTDDVSDDLQDQIIFANKIGTTELVLCSGPGQTTTKPTTIIPTTTPITTPHDCICPTTSPTTTTTIPTTTTTATRPPKVTYKILFSTSSKIYSGTSDTVYMELISKFGTSGMKNVSNYWKTGSSLLEYVTAPYYGELEKIVLFKGGRDGWRFERVHIQYTITENGIRRTNKYPTHGYSTLDESNPVVERKLRKL